MSELEGQPAARPTDILAQSFNFLGLPAYILSFLFPDVLKTIRKYPKLVRALSVPVALYFVLSYSSGRLLQLWQYLMTHFMSSVTISASDLGLSAAFRRFLESKNLLLVERDMTAHSSTFIRNQANSYGVAYNSNVVKSGAVNYEPMNDLQAFRHGNRFFFITSRASVNRYLEGATTSDFKVWTFGWSPEPIRAMIDTAYKTEQTQRKRIKTCIYAPDRGTAWQLRCTRGRRPLSSVYLDRKEKEMIMNDVKDFLDPSTAGWYSDRGIPYRRGYLFHGEPGTGKTSLAMALAGHFKLEVYILSLLDPNIDDTTLQILFQSLRKGVIVLLEDIDSAGIGRGGGNALEMLAMNLEAQATSDTDEDNDKSDDKTDNNANDNSNSNSNGKTNQDKKKKGKKDKLKPNRVTLSGLLNAIDGAGAPEGHILIMTSNKPDSLDEALVRAGRVDVRVKFEHASKEQIRAIFVNMYRPPRDLNANANANAKVNGKGKANTLVNVNAKEKSKKGEREKTDEYKQRVTHIRNLARKFAAKVPSGKLSPAQLQDYILMRKNSPERAVEEVQQWMREQLGFGDDVLVHGVESTDTESWPRGVGGAVKAEGGAGASASASGAGSGGDTGDPQRGNSPDLSSSGFDTDGSCSSDDEDDPEEKERHERQLRQLERINARRLRRHGYYDHEY